MTKEEVLEYNKRCVEFLGWEYNKEHDEYEFMDYKFGSAKLSDMNFHSDWNWIMEMVDAICREGFRKYSYSNEEYSRCVFTDMSILYQNHEFGGGNIIADSGKCKPEKEAVVKAINQFLIWYKENNK